MSSEHLSNLEHSVKRMQRLLGEADYQIRRTRRMISAAPRLFLDGRGEDLPVSEDGWYRYWILRQNLERKGINPDHVRWDLAGRCVFQFRRPSA